MEIAWNQTNPFFYRYDIQYAIQPCWKCNNYHQMHNLGIVTKLCIPSNIKIQLNLVPFRFWADWAVLALLKTKSVFFHYFITCCTLKRQQWKFDLQKSEKKVNIGVFIVLGMYNFKRIVTFFERNLELRALNLRWLYGMRGLLNSSGFFTLKCMHWNIVVQS